MATCALLIQAILRFVSEAARFISEIWWVFCNANGQDSQEYNWPFFPPQIVISIGHSHPKCLLAQWPHSWKELVAYQNFVNLQSILMNMTCFTNSKVTKIGKCQFKRKYCVYNNLIYQVLELVLMHLGRFCTYIPTLFLKPNRRLV